MCGESVADLFHKSQKLKRWVIIPVATSRPGGVFFHEILSQTQKAHDLHINRWKWFEWSRTIHNGLLGGYKMSQMEIVHRFRCNDGFIEGCVGS